MKALVLAGGNGTRLRPLTYSMPKQLVPVGNRPVLFHCLDHLRGAGVEEVGMVVGGRAAEIEAAVGDGSAFGVRVTYLHQSAPLGLAHCVLLAREFLGDDDFVMYLGDNLVLEPLEPFLSALGKEGGDARVLVAPVAEPSEYGIAELAPDGRLLGLAEKPAEPRSDLALLGVYVFGPAVHRAVRAIRPSARGELEITDAITWLLDNGHDVRADLFTGYWRDTGRVEDILDCNRELLDRQAGRMDGEVDQASSLSGQVVVEAGARVEGSRLIGPVVVGRGAVVRGSEVGPSVSVGQNSVLERSQVRDSIVMDGALLTDVRGVRRSLIGRSAQVSGAAAGGTGHRLVMGDHSRVEVVA